MKKEKILIVDDVETNRLILREILQDTYEVEEASSGYDAIAIMLNTRHMPDMVLLDIMMPDMDGFEVMSIMKNHAMTANIPVMFITASSTTDNEIKSLKLGAADYITKPFFPEAVRLRVDNCMELNNYRRSLEREVQKKVEVLTKTKENMLETLSGIIEYRDIDSGQHVNRTKYLAKQLIDEMLKIPHFFNELNELQYEVIISAAPMHDIGKIAIPDNILLKPAKLTEEEFEIIKTHTIVGGRIMDHIMDGVDDIYYRHCKDICLYHHERWDGTGYPTEKKGTDIPLSARILSVVDVYDALVSKRVYKDSFDYETSINIIIDGAGTQFDPEIAELVKYWKVSEE